MWIVRLPHLQNSQNRPGQDIDVQNFLLQTAILDRLTGFSAMPLPVKKMGRVADLAELAWRPSNEHAVPGGRPGEGIGYPAAYLAPGQV